MKVLICVSNLLVDELGLVFGGKLARSLQADISLLHVISKNKKAGDRKKGEILLREASSILGFIPDTKVKNILRRGDVVKQIVKEAERGDYEMVVTSVSRIGEGRQPTSSVHRTLLKNLPCCLLVVKNPRAEIKKILICTGGFQMAESLIAVGANIASASGSEATLFHVAANVPTMYTGLKSIEETLHELLMTDTPVARHLRRGAEILAENDIQAELKLRHGSAVYEIVREIDRENYDLVIIGASGANTMIKEWIFGNLTQDIIDAVGIPIMVVNQVRAANRSKFSI
jgi:nucleotide-binding universal stress UspA family protein